MSARRERRIERPEDARDAQRVLADGLGSISAGRGDGAHDRDRPRAPFGRQGDDTAGALVELGDPSTEIRRVALLAGHFLETARDLPHRLGPAARGIGHHCDVVSHVPVIFRDRDPRVHARLSGGDRHVRGVRNQDGPFHERTSGFRVEQFRKRCQHFGHLVAALAAADVDHDLRVGPLRELLLDHGLSGTEGSRNTRGSPLRHRKEGVDDALTGDERDVRGELLGNRARHSYHPLVSQCERDRTRTGRERTDAVANRVFSALQVGESSTESGRNQDLVEDELSFLDRAEDGSGGHLTADLCRGSELPDRFLVERWGKRSAGDEVPDGLLDDVERPLNSVVDGFQEPGTELHAERLSGGLDRVSGTDPGGVLVDLDRRGPAHQSNDLSDEAEAADTNDVVHLRVHESFGDDHWTGHSCNGTCHDPSSASSRPKA